MSAALRVLRVETGLLPDDAHDREASGGVIDYHVYSRVPRLWRMVEEALRLDLWLAVRARALSSGYDVIWAGSEKVAFPLMFLALRRPLVVIAHYPESSCRAQVLRLLRLPQRWAAVGYVADSSRVFMRDYYGVASDRLFQAVSAPLLRFAPGPPATGGPVVAIGVAKRDYETMIRAVGSLESVETHIYASSRYGDRLRQGFRGGLPPWVRLMPRVSDEDLPGVYRKARFMVLPLHDTTHAGAGASVFLEAAAAGKAVIATRTSGMASFIAHGATGLLVPPGDVAALHQAIRRLWHDPMLTERLGAAARRLAEERYDPRAVGGGIQRMLRSVAAEAVGRC